MRARLLAPRLLALCLPLAACGSGEDPAANSSDAPPRATQPPPRTPVLDIPAPPGNESEWIGPRPAPSDPVTAPYGNLSGPPVVDAPSQR